MVDGGVVGDDGSDPSQADSSRICSASFCVVDPIMTRKVPARGGARDAKPSPRVRKPTPKPPHPHKILERKKNLRI